MRNFIAGIIVLVCLAGRVFAATAAADVLIEKDVDYLGAGRKEKADLYRPRNVPQGQRCPGIVIIHGGGWSGGDKGAAREVNIGTTLARHGYVCMSINYVLAAREGSDVIWPRNLHDCKTAVRWLRQNAERLQLDPEHIGAIGGSAGGHLASMLALTGAPDGLDPKHPYGEFSCRIQAAVDLYGPADLCAWQDLSMLRKKRAEAPELYRSASPATYADKNDPPLLIIHGTADTTVDVQQSQGFAGELAKAGTPHQLVIVEGAPHSFHLQPKQRDLRPLVLDFFDRQLKGVKSGRQASTERNLFRVAAFGAKGDGRHDDGPAIQRALDAAIKAGPGAEVALEAGKIYRLGPDTQELAALRIGNARGLTLSGHGAMLVSHPANRPLSIFDSCDVAVRDLVLDFDPLPFTQARLTGLALDQGTVQFRVEPGYADPAVGGEELYRDFKSSDAVFLDGETRAFTHEWGRLRSVRALGGHLFEARFHAPDLRKRFTRLKLGDFIAIKRNFPEPSPRRDRDGRFLSAASANIYITFSRNVRLERIVSHAAPAMTFVASGAEGVVLDGCKVIRKPGTDRLIASNSDGAHLKSLTVMPQIRNTVFEALMDDSVNIKVSSEVVKALQGRRVRLAHGDIVTDDLVIQPGQTLTFLGGPAKRYLGQAQVLAVQRIRYREAWVTLDTAVSELKVDDLAFLRPATEAIVDRCEFRSQLKTALVTHPPSLISDCVFDDVAYGVHAFFTDRIEGPPPMNLRVSRCSFIHPGVAAIALHLPAADSVPPGNRALLAEQCRIMMGNHRGMVLTAYNQHGIVLRNWEVAVEDGRTQAELIRLRGCTGIRQDGVVFTGAPGNH